MTDDWDDRVTDDEECEEPTRVVSESEFKERCLEMIEEILDEGGDVVITRDDQPLTRLVTYWRGRPAGSGKGFFTIHGDIVGPIAADWLDAPDPVVAPDS